MNPHNATYIRALVVEEEVQLTLGELCQACGAEAEHMQAWVFEGVLEPVGESPQRWRFSGHSLRRARLAQRLMCDLEINPPGVALVLDLLDEIAALRARARSTRAR